MKAPRRGKKKIAQLYRGEKKTKKRRKEGDGTTHKELLSTVRSNVSTWNRTQREREDRVIALTRKSFHVCLSLSLGTKFPSVQVVKDGRTDFSDSLSLSVCSVCIQPLGYCVTKRWHIDERGRQQVRRPVVDILSSCSSSFLVVVSEAFCFPFAVVTLFRHFPAGSARCSLWLALYIIVAGDCRQVWFLGRREIACSSSLPLADINPNGKRGKRRLSLRLLLQMHFASSQRTRRQRAPYAIVLVLARGIWMSRATAGRFLSPPCTQPGRSRGQQDGAYIIFLGVARRCCEGARDIESVRCAVGARWTWHYHNWILARERRLRPAFVGTTSV